MFDGLLGGQDVHMVRYEPAVLIVSAEKTLELDSSIKAIETHQRKLVEVAERVPHV